MPDLGDYKGPVLRAWLEPLPHELAGRKVFAFAGIGRPQKFFDTLRDIGAFVEGTQSYADHHFYSDGDLSGLKAQARATGAQLVTTEKDLVRIAPSARDGIIALAVRARFENPAALEQLLGRIAP
jgi:tetraacyldisaccharide 4'-kinase